MFFWAWGLSEEICHWGRALGRVSSTATSCCNICFLVSHTMNTSPQYVPSTIESCQCTQNQAHRDQTFKQYRANLVCFCWVFGHSDGKEPAHRVNTKTSYTADSMGTEACCFSADKNSLSISRIWEKWEVVFLTHTVNSIHFPSPSVHKLPSSRQDISISVNLKHQPRGLQHSCCHEIHVTVNGKNYKKHPQLKGFMECRFSRWQMDPLIDLSTFLLMSQHFSKSATWVRSRNSHLTFSTKRYLAATCAGAYHVLIFVASGQRRTSSSSPQR